MNLLNLLVMKKTLQILEDFRRFDLPSVAYEDFPNVVLEALALGKPVGYSLSWSA